jgi:hypothetical protein
MGEEKGGMKVIRDHGEESKKGLPRALTKNGAGERNCRESIGQESVECGPQKDCELVTTPEQAIYFL